MFVPMEKAKDKDEIRTGIGIVLGLVGGSTVKEVVFVSFVVNVICSGGCRPACAKIGGMYYRSLCFLNHYHDTLLYLLPAPVLTDRVYRRLPISTDERLEKKKIFDEKEGEWSRHAPVSVEAKSIVGSFLKYFWA